MYKKDSAGKVPAEYPLIYFNTEAAGGTGVKIRFGVLNEALDIGAVRPQDHSRGAAGEDFFRLADLKSE